MALPSPQFLVGLLLLLYLLSFILFAFIRVATGVSIQRLGYAGLRRIAFTPKDGVRIEIRGLGFSLHRPTFAQPTWVSIVLTEFKITVDLKVLGEAPKKKAVWTHWAHGVSHQAKSWTTTSRMDASESDENGQATQRSQTWKRLTDAKDRIKRLHRKIHWLRQVDLVAHEASVVLVDVGSVQVGGFTVAVDTRRKMVDRSRLFNHHKFKSDQDQRPAEWYLAARSILFTPEGKDSTELLDHCTLNVHGFLKKELEGLRDASIALKLGRLSIPFDDVDLCIQRIQRCREVVSRKRTSGHRLAPLVTNGLGELDQPTSREENIIRTVTDSREFASSILRGIHEFQFAVSFLGLTKQIHTEQAAPVYLNISMKEVGMDLLRLDPRSPAHLMYFFPNDIAHQALLAAISISVGIDYGQDHPERLLYLPMATATLNTTLPSKTIHFSHDKDSAERNTNILFANLVITSPSLDLDPKHLPLLLAMFQSHKAYQEPQQIRHRKRYLLRRLLPKAKIKISIHEPVIRVTLPPMDPDKQESDDFDLLISSSSSLSLDVESSHAADGEFHYALNSTFRMNGQQLYYQTAKGEKHNLLLTDYLEFKAQMSATPDPVVEVRGMAQTFSIYLVRPEISEGLRQIVTHIHRDAVGRQGILKTKKEDNFLRRLPPWLTYIYLQGSDFNVEIAGLDPAVSKHSRGVTMHLESWTAEYKQSRDEEAETKPVRRRAASRTINREEYLMRPSTPTSPKSPKRQQSNPTDGRRLAISLHDLEGLVIEENDQSEQEPTLSLPLVEIALSTLSDKEGPVFHIRSFCQSFFLRYSLYRHFALGMAVQVIRRSFDWQTSQTKSSQSSSSNLLLQRSLPSSEDGGVDLALDPKHETITFDIKAQVLQVKADMPADPPLMLQVFVLEAGRHRWTNPFLRSRLIRLYAENSNICRAWNRIVSVKSLRMDYRISNRRYGRKIINDQSFDIVTDAIRFAVPHQLVMHKIFDNIADMAKTLKQLHHRFKTGTNEYVLNKHPEGPKRVPRISLRSRAVLFELEDSAFEWKLGTIYRMGLMEQKQRLAREHAFDLKTKKMWREDGRGNSRYRAKSAHDTQGNTKMKKKERELRFHRRTKSAGSDGAASPDRGRVDQPMRYDKDGCSGISGSYQTSIQEARIKLHRLNAQTWKKRIDFALAAQSRSVSHSRSTFWGLDELPEGIEDKETILSIPQRPALAMLTVSDLDIVVDKPSFPLSEYPRFLHRVGKAMPLDTQYALLIPMHVQLNMGEAKLLLRDYPLPLLHFPAVGNLQSPRLASIAMKADFVIAEEFRDAESSRVSRIVVVPQELAASGQRVGGYTVDVSRTIVPVKTYSDITIDMNSSNPTRITWGTSYQPAIQDMMQTIENFTKPAVDPSERVGFWDKIRLTFHSRINMAWKGDADVHLILKGSRDPYMVTGHGAGFIMCWQTNVQLSVAENEDPRNFMVVKSGSYVLAIPDLSQYARQDAESESGIRPDSTSSSSSRKQHAAFRKTIMKLNGNVRWLVGLVFERNLENDGGRSFHFIPHYEVSLKNPKYAKPSDGLIYDAFRGFRSHHIHMSIAIAAPYDREWSVANLEPAKTYNSVHLTPRFFTHFFSWWSMFSGAMSLPVRQGALWPGVEKSSKKFGRHLATIKYNILVSPLYMSHIYKHKETEDSGSDVVSATGLKTRLDSFMFDLHQRREEFRTLVQAPRSQEDSKQNQTTGMRINQVQLDLIKPDVRAVSASIPSTEAEDVNDGILEDTTGCSQELLKADLSKFVIPDSDFGWIDMDDFIELGWILPSNRHPDFQILPLAFAPRFTYFRQTDHTDNISGDKNRTSAFGNESTHHCVMSARNDPRLVQCRLIEQRLERMKERMIYSQREVGEAELKVVRDAQGKEEYSRELEDLRRHYQNLQRKLAFLNSMRESLLERLESGQRNAVPNAETEDEDEFFEAREDANTANIENEGDKGASTTESTINFNNRFIIHNIHLKWSNSLRNIILRYIHQVSQRRGYVYYMSRKAVKFILDVVEEQNKSRRSSFSDSRKKPMADENKADLNVNEVVQQLLQDGRKFVRGDHEESDHDHNAARVNQNDAESGIAAEYVVQNAYLVRLIAPQIQLQSERNTKTAVLVTAKGMQLKILQIMDKDRVMDDVSGLVQRRFTAAMDSLQIFVTNTKTFSNLESAHMYSGSSYGAPAGTAWPPWVPFEVMFEFHTDPYGFQRVVRRTSASMRYDKHNTLRLKYSEDVSKVDSTSSARNMESRIDHLWVDFPHVRALCDSRQYYALYVIVLDLLLYHEPLEKTRNERLEKIMLASDFTDLAGAPSLVIGLQDRIRQLEEIKTHFQINEKYLDKQGWEDRIEVEKDIAVYEDELFFVMKAITTAQRKQDDRAQAEQSTGLLRWYISASEIVWHLVREGQESLAEFQLKNVLFDRTDNNDGSNYNSLEIEQVRGLNLLPNALYPQMFSPYLENNKPLPENAKCLKVQFVALEPIAGIPVMEHFEINLFPLKVQLEWEIGKKLLEYIFPATKDTNSGALVPLLAKNGLPSQDGYEDDETSIMFVETPNLNASLSTDGGSATEEVQLRLTPTLHLPHPSQRPEVKKKSPEKRPTNHYFRFLRDNPSRSGSELRRTSQTNFAFPSSSSTSLLPRPVSSRTSSILSTAATLNEAERTAKRFTLYRSTSSATEKRTSKKVRNDDLTQMMDRANNYMTLAYVKIPSMILCLSYKGKSNRNFEDVHDLVFKMPTLEYRNKTWSNLELAMQLKKDVFRVLISHAGAIVGNKFSHHRPSKQTQSRLRQIVNSNAVLNTSPDLSGTDSNSIRDCSPAGSDGSTEDRATRRSFTSGRQSSMIDTLSEESSLFVTHQPSEQAQPAHESIMGSTWKPDKSLALCGQVEDGRAFADELSRVDNTEPVHANLIHTLSRHLTHVAPFAGHMKGRDRANSGAGANPREGMTARDEDIDGPKKKSRTFGKKILGKGGHV